MDLLVCSLADVASTTLRDAALDLADWEAVDADAGRWVLQGDGAGAGAGADIGLYTIEDLHLHHDDVDVEAEDALGEPVDRVVFLSRHKSEAGVASLTVHPLGNYAAADYGGRDATLVPAPIDVLAPTLRGLADRAPDRYEATLEATHHGPHLATPACFAEVGSDEAAWRDEAAAKAVAASVLDALSAEPDRAAPVVVGVGGGHYAPRLTDAARTRRMRLGHVLPDYHLRGEPAEAVADRVALAVEATPGAEAALLDRKALGRARTREVAEMLDDHGVKVVRGGDLEPVDGDDASPGDPAGPS